MNRTHITRRRAFLYVEVITSIMILGLLAMVVGSTVLQARRTRGHYYWRQAAAYAIEAQLQRYRAGAAIDSPPPDGLVPDEIDLRTNVEPGTGDWEGFTLVTVTATVHRPAMPDIHERLSGYIDTETRP
ncbi:MAG: type II secretion system protein [Phycisphaerales bacterium]|nr:type II secretion system protein [Phycisphaerales bacterium]